MNMTFNKSESEKRINEFQSTFLSMKEDEPHKINIKSNRAHTPGKYGNCKFPICIKGINKFLKRRGCLKILELHFLKPKRRGNKPYKFA